MQTLNSTEARRLALARAGLLDPRWTGLPNRGAGRGLRARKAAHAIVRRFGYLQLDTVSIAGARSHTLVLLSRLEGFDHRLGEELLQPGEPLFEYWGHEACWQPLELYPTFGFRRRDFAVHPWWGDQIGQNPELADDILRRIERDGPIRTLDLEGKGSGGWWGHGPAKKVITSLWSRGDLAIRERRNFQRTFDLAERVIPTELLDQHVPLEDALRTLLLLALDGHGWATTGTLASTWRLRNLRPEIHKALAELVDAGTILPCQLITDDKRTIDGWIRPEHLDTARRLRRLRPRRDRGVLLSPFDPVLWDRARVEILFDFEQILEIFKPAPQRKYGYYCLPVLAGDRLVARYDLKADRKAGRLDVLSFHPEAMPSAQAEHEALEASQHALERYARSVDLDLKT